MKIVLISKTTYNTTQINNVSNIAISGKNVTITGSQTLTVSTDNYYISILW